MTTVSHEELLTEMPWVRRLARRLVRDASRADDAAQEALTRAMTVGGTEKRRGPALRGFLATATRVVASEQRRSERRRARREEVVARPEATRSTFDRVEARSAAQALEHAVDGLDEPYRTTVRLRYFEDLSTVAIAERMDVKPVAVRKRLSRALAMLRARLEGESSSPGAWAVALLPLTGPDNSVRGIVVLAGALAASVTGVAALERFLPEPPIMPEPVEVAVLEENVESVAIETPAIREEVRRTSETESFTTTDYRRLATVFQAMHDVARLGESACAQAAVISSQNCADCHGGEVAREMLLPFEGVASLFFDDGTLRAQGPVEHGKKHGPWSEWLPSGELAATGEYFDDERHGWWQLRSELGLEQGEFLYGRREGTWVITTLGGARLAATEFRGGKRHGLEQTWYPSGTPATESRWHAGKREGLARTWHPDGTLAREERYVAGALTSPPLGG